MSFWFGCGEGPGQKINGEFPQLEDQLGLMMNQLIEDPENPHTWIIGSAAEASLGAQVGEATLVNVHPSSRCEGRPCVVHHPSDHHMASWPLNWRDDRGFMERMCPCHGDGHPDPDDVAYQLSIGRDVRTHGCGGCCRG